MRIHYPAHCTTHNASCATCHNAQHLTHTAQCTLHNTIFPSLAPAHPPPLFSCLSSKPYESAKLNLETASTAPPGAAHKGSTRERPLSPAFLGPEETISGLAPHPGKAAHTANTHVLPLLRTYLPPNSSLFGLAQAQTRPQPAPYALANISTTSETADPSHCGMREKPIAKRTKEVGWSTPLEQSCATTGTVAGDVQPLAMNSVTSALAVDSPIMELKSALELRKRQALMPYDPKRWHDALSSSRLLNRYLNIPMSLRLGFDLSICRIYQSYTPSNDNLSLSFHNSLYREIVENEFNWKRYIGPCSREQVKLLIGPFQSSPLSLIPKLGKPGKYRAIHNFSHPNKPSLNIQSINYTINPTMFPCTWGTFATMCNILWHLPKGSEASVRDVAEAYRTIPVLPNQWPGLVVKLHDEDSYAINTNNNFGLASAGGVYGELCDAATDIF